MGELGREEFIGRGIWDERECFCIGQAGGGSGRRVEWRRRCALVGDLGGLEERFGGSSLEERVWRK